MNWLDVVILIGSLVSIAVYGAWSTRHRSDLNSYLKGHGQTPWLAIGLSVMATQASAITFMSTPGQGYVDGLGFVQIYYGVPIALLIISIYFLPIYRKLNVYTAYEYLEKRFDYRTRLLGAALFLLQRGLGAGLTIYAPAIVLTTTVGSPLDATIISCGLLVIFYTVLGGSDAVTVTQKYQMAIIFAGMVAAGWLIIAKLPHELEFQDALKLAGGFHKLNAVNFSFNPNERYTIWSGILGGTFLMLSYFGTDQSQVQRYISGSSLRESRLGLLFNAVCKIPMQFGILMLGVLMFLFYQFEAPPLFFNSSSMRYFEEHKAETEIATYQSRFKAEFERTNTALKAWLTARHRGDETLSKAAFNEAVKSEGSLNAIRSDAQNALSKQNHDAKANDADYVFITFILNELPHGVIGLLMAAFFAAALSSKAAELNALATSTSCDLYRHFKADLTDEECLKATKLFTALWGMAAIAVALLARLAENLIQAVNILGSVFYGVMLGLFVVAFFIKRVGGNAVFWAALTAQLLVFVLYFSLSISYLWYPLIGCGACVLLSLFLQLVFGNPQDSFEKYAS